MTKKLIQLNESKGRRRLSGIVVSQSGAMSAVVQVATKRLHPVYRKAYAVTKKYHAHNTENRAKVGDKVTIEETRPISKLKRWRIV